MITVTESAQAKIDDILAEENDSKCRLRIFVQGGGCSGFTYGFTLDKDINEDDFEFPAGKTNLIVDSMSLQYLNEAIIDYKEDIYGATFSIKNPNAQTTCGCGSSFSI